MRRSRRAAFTWFWLIPVGVVIVCVLLAPPKSAKDRARDAEIARREPFTGQWCTSTQRCLNLELDGTAVLRGTGLPAPTAAIWNTDGSRVTVLLHGSARGPLKLQIVSWRAGDPAVLAPDKDAPDAEIWTRQPNPDPQPIYDP